MRAASVAVLAALAIIAACFATPAAAALLHPPKPGHLNRHARPKTATTAPGYDSIGNATVQWQHTPAYTQQSEIESVRRSVLEPDVVLAYVPLPAFNIPNGMYLIALNATTGQELWHTHFAQANAPQRTCYEWIETPTTVGCLGQAHFAIAERHTGAIVASGQYLSGYQMLGLPVRLGQRVALTMSRVNYSTAEPNIQAVVLDAATGVVTSMGSVKAQYSEGLYRAWGGSLREASAGGPLEWTVVIWAQNSTQPAASCNGVFTVVFSSTGTASIVAKLFFAETSVFCENVRFIAYPDLNLVLASPRLRGDVVQAFFLNGTERFAIQLPAGSSEPSLVRLTPGFGTNGSASDGIIVLSGCNLTSINALNETNWQVHNCSMLGFLNSYIFDVSGESLVLRGYNGFAAKLSAVTGATQWFVNLPWSGWGACSNSFAGGRGTQVAGFVDVLACSPSYAFIRKTDGATVASIDVSSLWQDSTISFDFHETPGAPAGTGTLVLGGYDGTIMSVAVTPQL